MATLATLEDLYIEQLQDLYSAEQQILKALPKMASAASAPELKKAFEKHLTQSQEHLNRLDRVLKMHNKSGAGKTCKAMQGLIAEGDELMKTKADPSVMDAGLIASAQRVEHYEMAGYGCVRTWAHLLGFSEAETILQTTLDEEGKTDQDLTALAERVINVEAAAR